MKLKKIAVLAVAFTITLSFPFSVFALQKKLTENMNLKDLQNFAYENTYSYKIFEYQTENVETNLEDTENQLKYYENMLEKSPTNSSEYFEYKLKIAELTKQTELLKFENEYYSEEKEEHEKSLLNFNIKSYYYDIYLANLQIKSCKKNVAYLQNLVDVEKIKFDKGLVAQNSFDTAKINLELAENSLQVYESELSYKQNSLTNYLNVYEDTDNFSINSSFPSDFEYKKYNFATLYIDFTKNNFDFLNQEKNIELTTDYLEILEEIYGEKSNTYLLKSNEFETLKLNTEIKINEQKLQISTLVKDYENAYNEYLIFENYNLVLDERKNISKISFQKGRISESEYLKTLAEISSEKIRGDEVLCKLLLLQNKIQLVENGVWVELDV